MKRQVATLLSFLLTANLFILDAAYGEPQTSPSQQRTEHTEQETPLNPTSAQGKAGNYDDLFYQDIEKHGLLDGFLWFIVAAALVSGAFGGFVYHLINFKEIQKLLEEEAKRQGRQEIDPKAKRACCASHIAIGAAAAPATILLLRPESAFAFIAMSVVAGSAGSAVFRNVQDKIMANVAVAQASAEVEKEKHDKTKSEHRAAKTVALRLNMEQRQVLRKLMKMTEKPNPDQADWAEVKTIAEQLKALCQECRETLENPLNVPDRSQSFRAAGEEKTITYITQPPVEITASSRNGSTSESKG